MAKRKSNRWMIIGGIVLAALIAAAVYKAQTRPKGTKVATELVAKRTIKEVVEASGRIFPTLEVKISSDVSGEIRELYVEEGDSVRVGQILARIDPDVIQSQVERGSASVSGSKARLANAQAGVRQAESQLEQAQGEIERVKAQLANAKVMHDRNITLLEDGVISQADFDNSLANQKGFEGQLASARASLEASKANIASAKENVRAAEFSVKSDQATLKELNTSLDRTTIYAPISGIVTLLSVEAGERVVGTAQMSGTEMMRVADLSRMEVQVDVSENDVLRVEMKDPVEIEVDAYIDQAFSGIVRQIAHSANNTMSGSLTSDQVTNFTVTIDMDPNSYQSLVPPNRPFPFRPGMSASVKINTQTADDIIAVPIQAVTTREEEEKNKSKDPELLEVIFVVDADTVKQMEVKTGIQDDEYIQIVSGIQEEDEIVTAPYTAISRTLEKGKKVQIVEEDDLYKKDKS